MKFVNIGSGDYAIIARNEVIAKVERIIDYTKTRYTTRGGQVLPQYSYEIAWFDGRTEYFKRLIDIGNAYEFANYPGFGGILAPRPPRKKHK